MSFDWTWLGAGRANSANNLVTVSLGLGFSETFDLTTPNSGFSTITRMVTIAPGDTGNIIIDHTAHSTPGDGGGPVLDNVVLDLIPEPSSLLLGLVALPLVWWRKGRS